MRGKILHLMHLSMTPFQESVDQIVASLKRDLEQSDALTPERASSLDDYKRALLLKKEARDTLIADVYEQNFSEAEIDALIAFHKSDAQPLLEKLGKLAHTLAGAGNAWINEVLGEVSILRDGVNELAAKWLGNNVEFDTLTDATPLPEAPPADTDVNATSVPYLG